MSRLSTGISADALAKLLLIQSMANQLPDETAILDFVCRGLGDMPGVKRAHPERTPVEDGLDPAANGYRLPVQLEGKRYAEIVLTLEDRDRFLPYLPYIQNLSFMVAVILEEKRLRREREQYSQKLESRVQERTSELSAQVREREAAERAAIAEKWRAERYLEVAEAITLELDVQGRIERINTWGGQILGYLPGELVGRSWIEVAIPPEDRESVQDEFRQIVSGDLGEYEYVEREIVTRAGEKRLIAWHNALCRDLGGEIHGTLSFGSDITDRMEAEKSLRMKQRDLDHAQAVAHIGSWRYNLRRNTLVWSDEVYRIFGVAKGTPLTYEMFMDFVHPEDRAYVDTQWAAALSGTPYDIDHRIILDGVIRWVREKAELEFDEQGELLGGFGTVQDITDRKQLEMDLLSSMRAAEEANRAKSEFLANMSHELRTPLTVIMGALGLMETKMDPSEQRQVLSMADSSAQHLLTIITELLDYSSLEAGRLEIKEKPFDLRSCVHRAAAPFTSPAREKGLNFDVHVSADLAADVFGDSQRLEQVLKNLLGNAVKFTERGRVQVTVRRYRGNILFKVEDTGIGIPAEKMERIFDPFVQVNGSMTRPYGGTGLGLALCKELIEQMGGKIHAESAPGEGSVFSFVLPLKELPRRVDPTGGEKSGPLRVLLAEDELMIRNMIKRVLDLRGAEVVLSENGVQALERWAEGDFDLILMDLQMPEMDGLEATERIRALEAQRNQKVCIFALTAHARSEDRKKCLKAGMDGVLTKPFRIEDLDAVIRECPCDLTVRL